MAQLYMINVNSDAPVELEYLGPQGGNTAKVSVNWAVVTVVKDPTEAQIKYDSFVPFPTAA